ncbi:hypothetical protein [Mesorhizobium sp. B2-3-10]|uniref:hypothetical protein n=1 Tax=Mesorhizobium sp. B2-3-10 TaxID=2589954 RepID=UPI00112D77CD|nr:hypothetical protein [Mesorhizobium sp. B2-3-10]TPM02118.1 hypothetical protein FJ943_08495 [Mesorhizobium sp. B2-3-10]
MRKLTLLPTILLASCSIYPLPDDIMAYSSRDIATQVRCETRYALQQQILDMLTSDGDNVYYDGKVGSAASAALDSDRTQFHNLSWKKFKWEGHDDFSETLEDLGSTMVSYDFTLDGTENNALGFSGTVLGDFSPRKHNLGFGLGNDRTREVSRHYRVYDTFNSLVMGMTEKFCHNFNMFDKSSKLPDKSFTTKNHYLYPSTGMLRIETLVHDFIIQDIEGNLGSDPKAGGWKQPNMTDTITMTTKVSGNLNPTSTYTPLNPGWDVISLGLKADNYRTDKHTIIVDLSLPPDKTGQPVYDNFGRLIDPKSAAAAKKQADDNLDQTERRNFEQRTTVFVQ